MPSKKQSPRRGRPVSKVPSVPVLIRFQAEQHAALRALAQKRGVSVAAIIKMGVSRMIEGS